MKVYRVDNFGWSAVSKSEVPVEITSMRPALVLGTKESARAGVFHVNGEYVVVATLAGNDTTALVIGDFQHLLRVLSDLSSIIGGDLATRMHTDLQAQIEEANEQVMEVVKERNERNEHKTGEQAGEGRNVASASADAPTPPKFLRRAQD